MPDTVWLNAGPLGMISHPRPVSEIVVWLVNLVTAGVDVLIPEIADYEIRRELLRSRRDKGVYRLDQVKASLGYVAITTEAMLKAAEFWADARRRGRPTAHAESLDADVILATQAATLDSNDVVVATTNPRHLTRFVKADHWENIKP